MPTPASIAGRYGARWTRRSVASSTCVLPWSSFIVRCVPLPSLPKAVVPC